MSVPMCTKNAIKFIRDVLPEAKRGYSATLEQPVNVRLQRMSTWQEATSPDAVSLLLARIDQLEKLWLEPTEEMVEAGTQEIKRTLSMLSEEQEGLDQVYSGQLDPDFVLDDSASDAAVFVLQAMANSLPK